jgi:hypothetical protein
MISAAGHSTPASPAGGQPGRSRSHRHPGREPLVWLVVGIPLLTVVAGLITLWIAFQRADSNVTEDYYKEGLAINRKIERDQRARDYGLSGSMNFAAEGGSAGSIVATTERTSAAREVPGLAVELDLSGAVQAFEPQVTLRMTHPVHKSLDRQVLLQGFGGGRYRGRLDDGGAAGTRWMLAVETPGWRLGLDGLNRIGAGTRLAIDAVQRATRP